MSGNPLEELAERSGQEFRSLIDARERTAEALIERGASLERLDHDDDVSIVLMGSWGRAEVTSGSDDDFIVLVDGDVRDDVKPTQDETIATFTRRPGRQGAFDATVFSERIVGRIGLEDDVNSNLTRRMLLLLESVPATRGEVHATVRRRLIARYVDAAVKDYRPPRLLLNDLIRYWRTVCVDFAGKEQEGPEKWGLRNAKLRTSRKVLFAGGLLPVFGCADIRREHMPMWLLEQLGRPPTDRLAAAFLQHDATDPGGRALGAYDEFLSYLNDASFREELQRTTRETAGSSVAFSEAKRLGEDLQNGLLALLFETNLRQLVREYAIF